MSRLLEEEEPATVEYDDEEEASELDLEAMEDTSGFTPVGDDD